MNMNERFDQLVDELDPNNVNMISLTEIKMKLDSEYKTRVDILAYEQNTMFMLQHLKEKHIYKKGSNICKEVIKKRVMNNLYDLSYEKYCDRYSSSNHDFEIKNIETRLRELAIICNECQIKVPKEYIGYNGYEIDTEYFDFKHFDG